MTKSSGLSSASASTWRITPDETEAPATSLWAEGLTWVTEAEVLEAFAGRFHVWKERLFGEGFADVRERWLALAIGVGEPVEVRLEDEVFAGTFAALDDGGALVLECGDGERRLIAAGDVFFPAD